MSALLTLVDLHARYGDSHVLRGVSLEIAAGVSLGLLGRNGMGKTTLIRTAMGYVRAAGADGPARHRLRSRRARHLPEPLGAREPGDGGARRPRRVARLDLRARP